MLMSIDTKNGNTSFCPYRPVSAAKILQSGPWVVSIISRIIVEQVGAGSYSWCWFHSGFCGWGPITRGLGGHRLFLVLVGIGLIPGPWSGGFALKQGFTWGSAGGRTIAGFVNGCISFLVSGRHLTGHWLGPGLTGFLAWTTTETFTNYFAYINFLKHFKEFLLF